uniref:Thiamine biosynthesis protein ThiS n=1 Tax=Desulfobacca acetoxidans TaxID=60893 RepID=A0A7C3V512_9BACT
MGSLTPEPRTHFYAMPLQVFLNASLRRYVPGYDPYRGLTLEAPPGTAVSRLISQLGLPPEEVTLIMVNGIRRPPEYLLQGEERVGLFPPIGGG